MKIMCLTCTIFSPLKDKEQLQDLIEVKATPKHEKGHTVQGASYVFSYHITIVNLSDTTVQLQRRHWYISDGLFGEREVEGEGVIGQMPTLKPGDKFEYESWCPVSSEYGSMSGYFTFEDLKNKEEFDVEIPTMVLLPEFALN